MMSRKTPFASGNSVTASSKLLCPAAWRKVTVPRRSRRSRLLPAIVRTSRFSLASTLTA